MKLQEAEINKFMPKGWVIVPTSNGTGTIYDCMDGDGQAYEREMHRAAFTIHACYKRIEELEVAASKPTCGEPEDLLGPDGPLAALSTANLLQQIQDLQEALDDKVRVTREISDLIDPVAAGGATSPALIDVQAQLERDLPLLLGYLRHHLTHSDRGSCPELEALLHRYRHVKAPR